MKGFYYLFDYAQLWLFYVHLNIFKSWYKATVFSSPELKAQVSFSDHLSSVVCPSVCLCKFSHFHLLLQNHWANFNQTWHKVSEGEGDSRLFKWRPRPSQRGDNWELIKINWQLLKIFSSRTTGPILTKLGTKYPWVKGFQVCLNEGPHPSPRGDNNEIAKIHWQNSKIFYSRTTWTFSTKLVTMHPWVKGIQVCLNKRPNPLPRGDYYKNSENTLTK